MLLAELVATSAAVASTRSRTAKVAALAGLFSRLTGATAREIESAVAFATGELRQGKVGVGWATAWRGEAEAAPIASLSVLDVDDAIEQLITLGGPGSVAARAAVLDELMRRATAEEQDHLRRLLVGELRQGALAGLVTEAVARASGAALATVRRAAMLAGNLPDVAVLALTGGSLDEIGLTVMRPILPMLAATASDVTAAVTGLCSVEWKLDGARIQAHRLGEQVGLYTRNLNDVTDRLPGVVEIVASLPVSSVVLDGEVLGVGDEEKPDRFQDIMSRFGRQTPSEGAPLTVAFFDCLHLDGRDLLDEPLTVRATALDRAAGPWRIPSVVTASPEEAAGFLESALAAGHEGVMVKDVDSAYAAGRRGQSWRKVKPVRTFDLVVLAAEWGHGRRRGWLSNLHLGARDGSEFVMVGKTFKGLTDELLAWQTTRFQELATRSDDWVVWVRPEQVVEIALDGVQRSTRYPGGVALRFARVKRYRDDKMAGEADTIDDLRALLG